MKPLGADGGSRPEKVSGTFFASWHKAIRQQAGFRAVLGIFQDAERCFIIFVTLKDRHPRWGTTQNVIDEVLIGGSL